MSGVSPAPVLDFSHRQHALLRLAFLEPQKPRLVEYCAGAGAASGRSGDVSSRDRIDFTSLRRLWMTLADTQHSQLKPKPREFNSNATVILNDDGASYRGSIFTGTYDNIVGNFEELKHQLTKFYKQDAYAQSYDFMISPDGINSAIVIKPLEHPATPNYSKINCHYVPYAEQGLSFLQGAYDLFLIKKGPLVLDPDFINLKFEGLDLNFKNFLAEMAGIDRVISKGKSGILWTDSRTERDHRKFQECLEVFNGQVLAVLQEIFPDGRVEI